MGFHKREKVRASIYDKVIKQALGLLRQELAPLQSGQEALMAQTEKINDGVRKLLVSVGPREEGGQENGRE